MQAEHLFQLMVQTRGRMSSWTSVKPQDTLFLPIDLDANLELRTATVDIPGIMTSSGKPIVNEFNDQRFHIALARSSGSFEFIYAEIGLGKSSVTGDMEIAFTTLIRMG